MLAILSDLPPTTSIFPMADFIMPRITFQGPDVLSSDERTNTEPKLPKRTIQMTTHWCLQCFRHTIRYWDDIAYELECTIDATSPHTCEFCEEKGIKCDWVNLSYY